MKVLLVNPAPPQRRVVGSSHPRVATQIFRFSMLSSLYVAACLPPDVVVQIVDEEVDALNLEADADVIGISFMTFNAPRAYELADFFRRQRGKTVLFGGYHPTFCPEEAAEHADAVCVGEAEANVPAMIRDLRAGRLQPIYRNHSGGLAGLPVPDRRLIHRSAYALADAVQATRGCPHACTFCSVSAFSGRRFRMRPVDEVISEIRTLGRVLIFMDDNLTANRDYALELFARMEPLHRFWVSQCSVNIGYDEALMDAAARSGCRGLFLGLESLSEEGLTHWGKGFNRAADYRRIIERLHRRGIAVIAGIVFGHDWDTPAVFARTLQFLHEARVDALQATILTPFPGTPLFAEITAQGRLTDRDWGHFDFAHVVFEPARMSQATLRRGHRWVLQQFYSGRAVLHRILRGLAYLGSATVVRGTGPLNLSYRSRLKATGILAAPEASLAGREFERLGRVHHSHARVLPGE